LEVSSLGHRNRTTLAIKQVKKMLVFEKWLFLPAIT